MKARVLPSGVRGGALATLGGRGACRRWEPVVASRGVREELPRGSAPSEREEAGTVGERTGRGGPGDGRAGGIGGAEPAWGAEGGGEGVGGAEAGGGAGELGPGLAGGHMSK